MKAVIALLVGVCLLVVSGCETQTGMTGTPPRPPEFTREYRIGVGDTLTINVWKSPELSLSVPVRPDGKISVPLSGDIKAAGTTAEELAAEITTSYGQFIRNPQVTVIVTGPTSAQYLRRVRITGAVRSPLSVQYAQGMTVLDLVLASGGATDFAHLNQTKLYRKVGDEVTVYAVRLNDILKKGKLETNYELAPSDILTVPERAF